MTFTLAACPCILGGDRVLVDDDDEAAGREPYRDCRLCRGAGTIARACFDCGQLGERRAQLVLSVVNLDTGAAASVELLPGGLEPTPTPAGGWRAELTPLVRRLAATVDAAGLTGVSAEPLAEESITLPAGWRPDLPPDARLAIEAEALAARSCDPWRVWLGRTVPPPERDPGLELGRLCAAADLLCLDLIVEARRSGPGGGLVWDVRFEVPGADVPVEPPGRAASLPAAVTAASTVDGALRGLAERGRTAPAHYLRTEPLPGSGPRVGPVDLDRLARRVAADLGAGGDLVGAQAIWRDRRGPAGRSRSSPSNRPGRWSRGSAPGCSVPPSRPRRPGWASRSTGPPARTAIRAAGCACGPVWMVGGRPVVQLPDRYRLARWAPTFRVRPADLTELDGDRPIAASTRDALVALPEPGTDPVRLHLASVSRGRPAARVLIRAAVPAGPPLPDLIRLALGLHLALTVTMQDHRLCDDDDAGDDAPRELDEGWDVEVTAADLPVALVDAVHPSLEAAIAAAMTYLEVALATTLPADPRRPIRVPRTTERVRAEGCPELIGQLGRRYAGQPVTVRFDRDGCTVYLHDDGKTWPLATANTLASAVAALGLTPD